MIFPLQIAAPIISDTGIFSVAVIALLVFTIALIVRTVRKKKRSKAHYIKTPSYNFHDGVVKPNGANAVGVLPNGTLLHSGTYRVVRFIKGGGFGCTYEAQHVMLQKRVAIKEFFVKDYCNRNENSLHVTVATESKRTLIDKLKRKFIDEARALCALNHENIVKVSDIFEQNGTAYFVMDYIDGNSLSDLVKLNGPLPELKAMEYIRQISKALAYVHKNNRLHLDVKPGNIMVDGNGRAVLIDFGASKQYDECDGENTSTLLGMTPGYAPPEQMGNDVVKFLPSTDIYALGATLYKLLSGVTPISATRRISGDVLAPMPLYVSKSTCDAVMQAMQLNKGERPQSVEQFIKLLYNDDVDMDALFAQLRASASALGEEIKSRRSVNKMSEETLIEPITGSVRYIDPKVKAGISQIIAQLQSPITRLRVK